MMLFSITQLVAWCLVVVWCDLLCGSVEIGGEEAVVSVDVRVVCCDVVLWCGLL